MSSSKALVLVTFALASIHAVAAGSKACPARHDGQPLATGYVLDGPLADNAILEADSGGTRHGVESARWQVGYVYEAGRQVTLDCRYGADKVSAPLVIEAPVKACSYSKSKKGDVVLGCR